MQKKITDGWHKIGHVGVDSGCLILTDPCYVMGQDWSKKDYEEKICAPDWGLFKQVSNPNAVVFTSGFGDGVYDVFALVKANRVVEVKIQLIG